MVLGVTVPLLEVYSKAAWNVAWRILCNGSSMFSCIANPASGLMFGNDNKSVERTKKFPWKFVIVIPLVALFQNRLSQT